LRAARLAATTILRSCVASLCVAALSVAVAACGTSTRDDPPAWRADCAPPTRPPPLSREAARDAERLAARRRALRFREAAAPRPSMRAMHAALDPARVAAGDVCPAELADLGQLLFEHEYGFADGLGGGAAAKSLAGPFRRVHAGTFGGPETISCPSC